MRQIISLSVLVFNLNLSDLCIDIKWPSKLIKHLIRLIEFYIPQSIKIKIILSLLMLSWFYKILDCLTATKYLIYLHKYNNQITQLIISKKQKPFNCIFILMVSSAIIFFKGICIIISSKGIKMSCLLEL